MWKWKVAFSYGLLLIFISFFSLSAGYDYDDDDQKLDAWSRCPWIRNKLKNGRVRVRSRGRIAKFSCKSGYDLVGKRFATCVRGQWNNPVPLCITKGCRKILAPTNGKMSELNRGAALSFHCSPGYSLVGDSTIYCDGNEWDKEPPMCQVTTLQPQTSCDFEDPDMCGWTHDSTHHFDWKRHQFGTPSGHVGTGPSYDHTYGKGKAGFYMYEEASAPRNENDTSRLFSPVYSRHYSPGCFVFWYHMYGATIGRLRVYVKPESSLFIELNPSWEKYGDQGNQWLRGNVTVPSMSENFQIVIEGIRGSSYVGDTAIDDVSLFHADCSSLDSSNSTEGVEASEDSCRGRCHEIENSPSCGCTDACELNNTCCSDYSKLCAEKNETPNGEEDSKEYLPTTGKLETDALPELTAVEKIGTPLTATSIELYTKAETSSEFFTNTTEKNTQQPPMTETIPLTLTASLSTGGVVQRTDTSTTNKTNVDLTTTTTTTTPLPTVFNETLPVNNETTKFLNVTSPIALSTESKKPTANLKASTLPSTVPTTTVKATTTITTPTTTTTAATTKGLPVIIHTPGISTSAADTVTDSMITTSHVASRVPTTTAETVTPRIVSSSTTPEGITRNAVSTAKKLASTISTGPVTMSTLTFPPTVSEVLTSKTMQRTNIITTVLSPKTPPYTTSITTQTTTGRDWKTSTSVKIVPTTSKLGRESSTVTSVTSQKMTVQFIPTLRKTTTTTEVPASLSSTVNNVRTVKATTKQVVLFYTTENQPIKSSSKSDDARASETKADMPRNHGPSVIGICIGVISIAGLVGGVAYVYLRRRRQKQNKLRDDSEMRYLSDNEVVEYSDASALDRLIHS